MTTATSIIGWIVIIVGGWWAVGYAFNSLCTSIWYRLTHRDGHRPPRPQWHYNLQYIVCGPVGWIAWLVDR